MILTVFEQDVLAATKKISKGCVSSYGEVAIAVGCPRASRAVGNALHKNPYAPIVPCHRVVKSNGELGGFGSGVKNKIKLLAAEGIKIKSNKIINFKKVFYKYV